MPNLYDLDKFVITNAPYLTISDMVDELKEAGFSRYDIQKVCDRLNITPISKGEQTKADIKYWADKKTKTEYMKMSGMGKAAIDLYCKELNIQFLDSPKIASSHEAPLSTKKEADPMPIPTQLQSTIAKRLAGVKYCSQSRDNTEWTLSGFRNYIRKKIEEK